MSMSSTSVKLEPELKARVQKLALARKRTSHWLMKEAIEQYITREEVREAEHRDAVQSWEHYQATGLHVTGDEAIEWLETWGTDNEKPTPECHK